MATKTDDGTTVLLDVNDIPVWQKTRVVWASTSVSPHPKSGIVINRNTETGTVTVRADYPDRDVNSVATLPSERTMRVTMLPVVPATTASLVDAGLI